MNDYSVKELVTEIVIPKLDAIQSELVEKADRERVHSLISALAAFEKLTAAALTDLEKKLDQKADTERVGRLESWRTYLTGFGSAVAVVAGINGYRLWF